MPGEPLAPRGVSLSGLHTYLVATYGDAGEAFFVWLSVDHPVWARQLAARLESAKAACAVAEGAQP